METSIPDLLRRTYRSTACPSSVLPKACFCIAGEAGASTAQEKVVIRQITNPAKTILPSCSTVQLQEYIFEFEKHAELYQGTCPHLHLQWQQEYIFEESQHASACISGSVPYF